MHWGDYGHAGVNISSYQKGLPPRSCLRVGVLFNRLDTFITFQLMELLFCFSVQSNQFVQIFVSSLASDSFLANSLAAFSGLERFREL